MNWVIFTLKFTVKADTSKMKHLKNTDISSTSYT